MIHRHDQASIAQTSYGVVFVTNWISSPPPTPAAVKNASRWGDRFSMNRFMGLFGFPNSPHPQKREQPPRKPHVPLYLQSFPEKGFVSEPYSVGLRSESMKKLGGCICSSSRKDWQDVWGPFERELYNVWPCWVSGTLGPIEWLLWTWLNLPLLHCFFSPDLRCRINRMKPVDGRTTMDVGWM